MPKILEQHITIESCAAYQTMPCGKTIHASAKALEIKSRLHKKTCKVCTFAYGKAARSDAHKKK